MAKRRLTDARLLAAIRETQPVGNKVLAQGLGFHNRTIRLRLRGLLDAGKIEAHGADNSPDRVYCLPGAFPDGLPVDDLAEARIDLIRERGRALTLDNDAREAGLIAREEAQAERATMARELGAGLDALPERIRQRRPNLTDDDLAVIRAELAVVKRTLR